jgi:hypothetical protein
LQGSLEPFEYPQEPTGEISVSRDGYTLTIDMRDNGKMTLTGPDGAVIHTLSEEDMWGEGNADGVVRTNPFTGTPTFLDPDTGEDLVSFTDEDFEAAWGSVEDDWVEPEYGMEILFSADGTTWTVIEDERLSFDENEGSVNPVAVGDDEIIFAKHTWNEPPAELFAFEEEGREPTGAEIEALEGWESQFAGDNAVEYIRVEV